jgi:hypothetical protein
VEAAARAHGSGTACTARTHTAPLMLLVPCWRPCAWRLQMLDPPSTDYVDRRFKGTKVGKQDFFAENTTEWAAMRSTVHRHSHMLCQPPSLPWVGGKSATCSRAHLLRAGGSPHPPPTRGLAEAIISRSPLYLQEEYFARLAASATLYIGNLSFYTTEDQVGGSACTSGCGAISITAATAQRGRRR